MRVTVLNGRYRAEGYHNPLSELHCGSSAGDELSGYKGGSRERG